MLHAQPHSARRLSGANRADCIDHKEHATPSSDLANGFDVVEMPNRSFMSINQQRCVSIAAQTSHGDQTGPDRYFDFVVRAGMNVAQVAPPLMTTARSDASRKFRTAASIAAVPDPVSNAEKPQSGITYCRPLTISRVRLENASVRLYGGWLAPRASMCLSIGTGPGVNRRWAFINVHCPLGPCQHLILSDGKSLSRSMNEARNQVGCGFELLLTGAGTLLILLLLAFLFRSQFGLLLLFLLAFVFASLVAHFDFLR
jgi:hypothetical protein